MTNNIILRFINVLIFLFCDCEKMGHTILSLLEDLGILQGCSLEEIFL